MRRATSPSGTRWKATDGRVLDGTHGARYFNGIVVGFALTGWIGSQYRHRARARRVPKGRHLVIAYCACPHHVSAIVVDELRKRGFPHTAVLDEGIFAWQQSKYPVVAAPGMLPPPAPPPVGR